MKTKAANYEHIKWIEDLVLNTMWSQVPISYDKYALWGISHWGRKWQKLYGFVANGESARDVYSNCRIIVVIKLQIIEWHNFKHLVWITVHRDDDKLLKFKEGVESYQKKLNLIKPDTYRSDLKRRKAYTAYSNPRAQMEDPQESFNELMDTPLNFLAFVMNQLKVDTLTLELLVGPTFELMKGSCKSLTDSDMKLKLDSFINKLDDNIKKIIKDQVKEKVKAQVSKILPKIEKTINEQLRAEVLTCSSNESKTSHTVAAKLS
nr:hypothetical protein [Tanacetum cinerariifolium]